MTQTTKLTKELFNMVYAWGRWGLVVDHKAPAFKKALRKLVLEQMSEKMKGKLSTADLKI